MATIFPLPTSRAGQRSRAEVLEQRRTLLREDLPTWPVSLIFFGLPVYWLLGLTPFVLVAVGAFLAVFLVFHPRPLLSIPALIWAAFLLWVLVSASTLANPLRALGFMQTFSELTVLGLLLLYVYNVRAMTAARLTNAFAFAFAVVVTLGLLAVFLPDVVITTPVARLLPGALTGNELVHNLVHVRLAEVQQPWGADEPFNRPAAPFPYTNSWGMAYLCFLPAALAVIIRQARQRRWRTAGPLTALLALSALPVLASTNRAMLLGLATAGGYAIVRLLFRGERRAGMVLIGGLSSGAVALTALGLPDLISSRQEVSDTTSGRMEIYARTLEVLGQAPLTGWGAPRMDPTLNMALGTQGFVWRILFAHGWIGAALFATFLGYCIIRSWRSPTAEDLALHAVLIALLPVLFFYGLGTLAFTSVILSCAVLTRRADHGWPGQEGEPQCTRTADAQTSR